MKPSRKVSSGIEDLFLSRFENIINLRHELVVLGGRIAWTFFDETYEALYSEEGRPGVPTRLMVGLHILKHMFDLSDEEVCERWVGAATRPAWTPRRTECTVGAFLSHSNSPPWCGDFFCSGPNSVLKIRI